LGRGIHVFYDENTDISRLCGNGYEWLKWPRGTKLVPSYLVREINMVAFVYVLEETPYSTGDSGPWTKIGCSRNPPEWRIGANLTRGNPRNLRLAAVYEFETEKAAYEAEATAHAHFQPHYHQKEWFKISGSQVAEWAVEAGWRPRPN
jgi:hypothetical protein